MTPLVEIIAESPITDPCSINPFYLRPYKNRLTTWVGLAYAIGSSLMIVIYFLLKIFFFSAFLLCLAASYVEAIVF